MKQLFLIVDCSGSVTNTDKPLVASINDLLRNVVNECAEEAGAIHVVVYADGARKLHSYAKDDNYVDIPEETFGGRSSLGRAYSLLTGLIVAQRVDLSDCVFALITDGEATDNYAKRLAKLDPDNKSARLALCMGRTTDVTQTHASEPDYCFENGADSEEDFVESILDCLYE